MSITAIQSQSNNIQGQQLGQSAIQGISTSSTYQLGGTQQGTLTASTPYGLGGMAGGTITAPYYGYNPWYGGSTGTSIIIEPDIALRKVENGWILKMLGKEYVFKEHSQVETYLKLFEESK